MKQILDCKAVRDFKLEQYVNEIKCMKTKPSMAVIQVGDRKDSTKYVNNKIAKCLDCGIEATAHRLDEKITTEELVEKVKEIQEGVSAIIVQCPLPKHISEKTVMSVINPYKDCDGLTRKNIGYLHDQNPIIIPATAQGILDLIDYHKINVEGMDVLLIGRSNLVNRPLYEALLQRNATPTLAHSKTKNLQEKLSSGKYDMIVGAIGQCKFLRNVNTKYIIDVGINVDENGKLHGDFDIESANCEYYTTVPGGVGVLTVESVIGNIVKCHKLQYN